MKRLLGIAAAMAAASIALGQAPRPTPTPPPVVALKAARLFDGRSDTVVSNGVVVVQGDAIIAVGSGLAVPAGAQVIDLGDATLLRGSSTPTRT